MRTRNNIIGSVFIIFILVAGFIWFGFFDVAADRKHWKITQWFLEVVRDRSIEAQLSDISVPADLDDVAFYVKGAGNYDEMCSQCHLAPGMTSSELNAGLYPQPPDFTQHAIEHQARSFWVIKHGIKMTGMPTWGAQHNDEQIWQLVAFIRQLPKLDSTNYKELVAQNSSTHSHAAGHGDTHTEPNMTSEPQTQKTDDHGHGDHAH